MSMFRSVGFLIGLATLSSVEAQGFSMCENNNDYRSDGFWSFMCLDSTQSVIDNISSQTQCYGLDSTNIWQSVTCSQMLQQSFPDGNTCSDMGDWNYWWQHSIAISKGYQSPDGTSTDCCNGQPFKCENFEVEGDGDGNQGYLVVTPAMARSCKPHRKVSRDEYADLVGTFLSIEPGTVSGVFFKSQGPGALPTLLTGATLRVKLTDSHGVKGKLTPHQKHVEGYVVKHLVNIPATDLREATQDDIDMFNANLNGAHPNPDGFQLPAYNPSNGDYRLWYGGLDGALDSLGNYLDNKQTFNIEKLRVDGFLWFDHAGDMVPSHTGCMKVNFDDHNDEEEEAGGSP